MAELALDGINTNSTILGQTKNGYQLNRTPFGSSGGTATAIAHSLGVIGLGSDTCGSIINPSAA